MNGDYGSYNEHKRVEVSYDESYSEYKGNGGSHITHHGDKYYMRYDTSSHIFY